MDQTNAKRQGGDQEGTERVQKLGNGCTRRQSPLDKVGFSCGHLNDGQRVLIRLLSLQVPSAMTMLSALAVASDGGLEDRQMCPGPSLVVVE